MSRKISFPFRTVREDSEALRLGGWFVYTSNPSERFWLEPGAGIPNWSYDTKLNIGRELSIDFDGLLGELGISGAEAEFELVHTIKISSLGQRRLLSRMDIRKDKIVPSSTAVHTLEGHDLCEEITLCSTLVLKSNLSNVEPWAVSKSGSTCWSDETRILLEGFGSRFPMRDVSFSGSLRLASEANWHLQWSPGMLHYSFNSAVTLLLNADNPEFIGKMQNKDPNLTEEVMGSIMVQICDSALKDEDALDVDSDFPDGSLGAVTKSWLLAALPGRSLSDIKAEFQRSPALVYTALRALAVRTL